MKILREGPDYRPFYNTKTLYSTTKIQKISLQGGLQPPTAENFFEVFAGCV